jgi:hypothetical protein
MEAEMAPPSQVRIQPASNQDPTISDYIALWRFFEERGAKDKDHMMTSVTWLLAFAAVIIGFIVKEHFRYQPSFCIKDPGAIIIFSAVGLFVCILAIYLVLEFARHARRNFIKADYSVARIPGLDLIFIGLDVELRENGRWLSRDDLQDDLSIREAGRSGVLARVGKIFRNFIGISAAFGFVLLVLVWLGAAAMLGKIPSC